jgi:hypothetical protein
MPTIEVRFQNLEAEAEVRVGSSGLPTVLNSIVNTIEEAANALHLLPSTKRTMPILHDVSGIIKPRRYWSKMIAIRSSFLFTVLMRCSFRQLE